MLVATLGYMASGKKIERRYIEHVARELDGVVNNQFEGNQTRAAKGLGISQAHLSHLIAAEGRGPGLSVLLRMRDYTGKSIDALLGLPPVPGEELTERLRAALETEVARIKRDARMQVEQAQAKAAETDERQMRPTVSKRPRKKNA